MCLSGCKDTKNPRIILFLSKLLQKKMQKIWLFIKKYLYLWQNN